MAEMLAGFFWLACARTPMREIAPRIAVDQAVHFGRPVIAGTRVPVDVLVGKLAGGLTVEEAAEEYAVSREDVLAALAYAAHAVAEEQVRAL
jgi:uncharacterized protein (DUF433 family)